MDSLVGHQRAPWLADTKAPAPIAARSISWRSTFAISPQWRAFASTPSTLAAASAFDIRTKNRSTSLNMQKPLLALVRPLGCTLLIEPGRCLVGPSGVLLTRVIYVKENRGKTFVIVDAAMNDMIRPVLYDAIHPITPAIRRLCESRGSDSCRCGRSVCESGDFLARDYRLR